ncbi:hypothetical protein [Aliikangiella sp. IMCC44359]|uniref:hypothetical protein n=1 Tax=Aliikangiella sp. IMCC44359 TaxID=3459125 RepID=UPI00403B1C6E
MSQILAQMLEQLSDEDKQVFAQLSQSLKDCGGDIARLSEKERLVIKQMEDKYGDKIKATHQQYEETEEEFDILDMPFAQNARQILARDLGDKFPQEEEAIAFVFENKWMPLECQKQELVGELFNRFEQDIYEINRWREELVDIHSDKKMAVGLAWFMVVFQLNKRFNP